MNDTFKLLIGRSLICRIEDASQVSHDFALQLLPRHMRQGIVHQMELAALPGHAREASLPRLLQSRVRIADDQLQAV